MTEDIERVKVSQLPVVDDINNFEVFGVDKLNRSSVRAKMEQLKGNKGDKGDPFTFDDFTSEQLDELSSGLPSIKEFESYLTFPTIGKTNTLYIDKNSNKLYRWDADNLKYYLLNDDSFTIINGGN